MMLSAPAITAISAAFLASLVEVTEAYTIILAAGLSRGWRSASVGAVAALLILAIIVAALGPLLATVSLATLQLPIGILVLLFGMGWLHKAILRAGGVIPLHDEEAIFAEETALLRKGRRSQGALDTTGVMTAFQGVLLEGLEVVFIVVAVGAQRGLLLPASIGAAGACVLVLLVGMLVHKPLSRVPENTLKFAVGIMLSSFGIFWIGEAWGVPWPRADFALFYIAASFLLAGISATSVLRRTAS
jgi:uncharacterized membrane protein